MNLIQFKNKVSDKVMDLYAEKTKDQQLQPRAYYFHPDAGIRHVDIPVQIMENPAMLESSLKMFCILGKIRHFVILCEAHCAALNIQVDRDSLSELMGESPEEMRRNVARMIKEQAEHCAPKRILIMNFTSVETTEQLNVVMNVDENGQLDLAGEESGEISSNDTGRGVIGQFPTILAPGMF